MGGSSPVVVLSDRTRVRLGSGSHGSPREGVCVVELASVIAGEVFSDRPRCVCPVIAAYLRGWNDRAAHNERQRLAPYATLIVGSRGDWKTTRRRRDICLEWSGARSGVRRIPAVLTELGMRARIAMTCGIRTAMRPDEGAGDYAARIAMARRDPNAAFALLERLLAVGARWEPNTDTANGHGSANGHAAAKGHRSPNGDRSTNGRVSGPEAPATAGARSRE